MPFATSSMSSKPRALPIGRDDKLARFRMRSGVLQDRVEAVEGRVEGVGGAWRVFSCHLAAGCSTSNIKLIYAVMACSGPVAINMCQHWPLKPSRNLEVRRKHEVNFLWFERSASRTR